MKRVYIETSVISYLAARLSRDVVVVGHQQITQEWWDVRKEWELYVSSLVHSEAKSGDIEAATRRVALLENIPPLELTTAVYNLANQLVVGAALPAKAKEDAFHIAIATVHGMDYLLTWNCKHIANATMRSKIFSICEKAGYQPPVICTPEELLGDHNVERPDY
jgi:hypothetical protein